MRRSRCTTRPGTRAATSLRGSAFVPPDAPVTVLTNNGTGILSTPITVSELVQLVKGEKPIKLFESLDTGFWIRIQGDTVCALDQQYHP